LEGPGKPGRWLDRFPRDQLGSEERDLVGRLVVDVRHHDLLALLGVAGGRLLWILVGRVGGPGPGGLLGRGQRRVLLVAEAAERVIQLGCLGLLVGLQLLDGASLVRRHRLELRDRDVAGRDAEDPPPALLEPIGDVAHVMSPCGMRLNFTSSRTIAAWQNCAPHLRPPRSTRASSHSCRSFPCSVSARAGSVLIAAPPVRDTSKASSTGVMSGSSRAWSRWFSSLDTTSSTTSIGAVTICLPNRDFS